MEYPPGLFISRPHVHPTGRSGAPGPHPFRHYITPMFMISSLRAAALAATLLSCASFVSASDWRGHRPGGAVYTASNAVDGNRILVFNRGHNGSLKLADSFPTGGLGTGAGLGNQGGVVLTPDGDWLLTVNAGSAEVSLFEVTEDVLVLRDIVPSGGAEPLSITVDHHLVYVLNGGGSAAKPDNITGFVLSEHDGRLTPIPDSTRMLSGDAVMPAQVSFAPAGDVLVVTEKATNLITTFAVDDDGLASDPQPQASAGMTPFGFAFDWRGRLFVSEAFGGAADASAVSSYRVSATGMLSVVSPSVPTHQTAACWVAVDQTGRYIYATNAGSSSISGYRAAPNASITLLNADGATASTGSGSVPIDLARSSDGRFLYALSGGSNTISAYRILGNGGLEPVETETGIPAGAYGLAAR